MSGGAKGAKYQRLCLPERTITHGNIKNTPNKIELIEAGAINFCV